MISMVGKVLPWPSTWMSWESDITTPVMIPGWFEVLKVPSEFTVKVVLIDSLATWGELSEVLSPVPVSSPLSVMAPSPTNVSFTLWLTVSSVPT